MDSLVLQDDLSEGTNALTCSCPTLERACQACVSDACKSPPCCHTDPCCCMRPIVIFNKGTHAYERVAHRVYGVALTEAQDVWGILNSSIPEALATRYLKAKGVKTLQGESFKALLDQYPQLDPFPDPQHRKAGSLMVLKEARGGSFTAVPLFVYNHNIMNSLSVLFDEDVIGKSHAYAEMSEYFLVVGEPVLALFCKELAVGLMHLPDVEILVLHAIAQFLGVNHQAPQDAANRVFQQLLQQNQFRGSYEEDMLLSLLSLTGENRPKRCAFVQHYLANKGCSRSSWKDPMEYLEPALEEANQPIAVVTRRLRESVEHVSLETLLAQRLVFETPSGEDVSIAREVLESLLAAISQQDLTNVLEAARKRGKRGDLAYRLPCISVPCPGDTVFILHGDNNLVCSLEKPKDTQRIFACSVVAGAMDLEPYMVADPYADNNGVNVVYFGHAYVKTTADPPLGSWMRATGCNGYAEPCSQDEMDRIGRVIGPRKQRDGNWFVPCLVFVAGPDAGLADLTRGLEKLKVTVEECTFEVEAHSAFSDALERRIQMVEEQTQQLRQEQNETVLQVESIQSRTVVLEEQYVGVKNSIDDVHKLATETKYRVDEAMGEGATVIGTVNSLAFSLNGEVTAHLDREPQFHPKGDDNALTKDMLAKAGANSKIVGVVNSAAVSLDGNAHVHMMTARAQFKKMSPFALFQWLSTKEQIPQATKEAIFNLRLSGEQVLQLASPQQLGAKLGVPEAQCAGIFDLIS